MPVTVAVTRVACTSGGTQDITTSDLGYDMPSVGIYGHDLATGGRMIQVLAFCYFLAFVAALATIGVIVALALGVSLLAGIDLGALAGWLGAL